MTATAPADSLADHIQRGRYMSTSNRIAKRGTWL
jgi:hypothetical protein